MMHDELFTGSADATCKPIAFQDSQFEPWVEVRTVGLPRSPMLPPGIALTGHSSRHHFLQGHTFWSCHKAITFTLTIFVHTLPRAILSAGRGCKHLAANRACLFSRHIMPFLVHGVGWTRQTRSASFLGCNFFFGFRRTVARMFDLVFKVALIGTKLAHMPLIRIPTIETEASKALGPCLTFCRAILASRDLCMAYIKRFATLITRLCDATTSPIRTKRPNSSLAPPVVTRIATEVVVAFRLPARSLVTFPARIASDLYHVGNHIILCEVSQ